VFFARARACFCVSHYVLAFTCTHQFFALLAFDGPALNQTFAEACWITVAVHDRRGKFDRVHLQTVGAAVSACVRISTPPHEELPLPTTVARLGLGFRDTGLWLRVRVTVVTVRIGIVSVRVRAANQG